jgi:hypothetical protein
MTDRFPTFAAAVESRLETRDHYGDRNDGEGWQEVREL